MQKFQIEFPDFDPKTMPDIPRDWRDASWHNDSCPSFNARNGKIVFIDYANDADREHPGSERFSVHSDPEIDDANDVLFVSDDWQAILDFVGESETSLDSLIKQV